MDRSVGNPRNRSVVGVRGPGVSVFGLTTARGRFVQIKLTNYHTDEGAPFNYVTPNQGTRVGIDTI